MGILQRKTILFCILYFGFGIGKINGFSEDDTPFSTHSYDFIIVGGGTAGCAVASRLSENGKYSVLVLESGDYPEDFMEVPALGIRSPENPAITFQYFSVPQRTGLSTYRNGVIPSPVARVLGGTSQINHNVINRGNPKDYDNWANLTGDPTWKYSNMLRYFKRSETYLGQFPDPEQHGFQGPVPVSYQHYAPGREVFEEAVNELGHQLEDPNGPQRISFTPVEFSRKFGRRHSSYRAYIESIVKPRKNLKIIVKAHATEIIFDEEGHRAIGVKYILNGTAHHFQKETVAWANREIILSSGTFGSSLLLMKSGIGPRKVLEDAGIPQRIELPVGENFQDHPTVVLYIVLNNKSLSFDMERDLTRENFEIWRKYGIGPYSTALGYSGQTFQASKVAQMEGNGDWPDHHIALGANTMLLEPFRGNYLEPWETFVRIHIYLGRQKSRGTVKIDRDGEPIIDYNYMEDKRDEDVFFDGVQNTLKLFLGTKAYQKKGARLFKEPLPACAGFKFRTEKYWRCYIKHVIIPGYHPVGTCAMGSVVDSKLRVYGFKGLRVVDGSIQPFIVNSNLHAGIYAIAEKASEDILKDNEEVEDHNSHFWREHRDLRDELPNKNKDYSLGWRN